MRKLLVTILLLLLGGSAVVYYYVQQATQVPKWYQVKSLIKKEVNLTKKKLESDSLEGKLLKFKRGQEVKLELSSEEINELIKLILLKELGNQHPEGLPDGIQAKIENNKLEIGGIVNLATLAQLEMKPHYKAIIEKLVSTFPQFANKDIYLGVYGDPLLNDGKVSLSPESLFKVGNLSFTKGDISQVTGFSEAKVQQKLAVKLRSITVKELSIKQDKLNIRLGKTN